MWAMQYTILMIINPSVHKITEPWRARSGVFHNTLSVNINELRQFRVLKTDTKMMATLFSNFFMLCLFKRYFEIFLTIPVSSKDIIIRQYSKVSYQTAAPTQE